MHKGWLLRLDDAVSMFEEVVGLEIGTRFDSLLVFDINIEVSSCRFVFLKLKVGLCVFDKGVGSTHTRINTYVYIYIYTFKFTYVCIHAKIYSCMKPSRTSQSKNQITNPFNFGKCPLQSSLRDTPKHINDFD